MLNILGLLDNPTNGTFYLDGIEVSKYTESQRTNLRKGVIGFVFQSFNLIEELNVYENIELPLLYMGFPANDDNDAYYLTIPNALVTVKPTSENAFFLQLDDTTTLLPVNMTSSPFGSKEVRALTNFSEVNEPSEGYSKAVHINWIDSILTKNIAPDLGAKNDSIYGKDPVEIVGDWLTIAEDGYLNLLLNSETSFGSKN